MKPSSTIYPGVALLLVLLCLSGLQLHQLARHMLHPDPGSPVPVSHSTETALPASEDLQRLNHRMRTLVAREMTEPPPETGWTELQTEQHPGYFLRMPVPPYLSDWQLVPDGSDIILLGRRYSSPAELAGETPAVPPGWTQHFSRRISLPMDADPAGLVHRVDNQTLLLHVPRRDPARSPVHHRNFI